MTFSVYCLSAKWSQLPEACVLEVIKYLDNTSPYIFTSFIVKTIYSVLVIDN